MTRYSMFLGASACWLMLLGSAAAQTPHSHRHGFDGAQAWARVFDHPKRDAWQRPDEVIQALALAPTAHVADIGAGTGYFASRLSRRLGNGTVYAVDLEPDMVRHLRERAQREGLSNLVPVQADAADARLPAAVDLVLFVDTYHHLDERSAYLRKLRASLRPEGRIAVIDFKRDAPVGPPPSARIDAERVTREFEQAGYALAQEHRFLPYQYFLVFVPRKPQP